MDIVVIGIVIGIVTAVLVVLLLTGLLVGRGRKTARLDDPGDTAQAKPGAGTATLPRPAGRPTGETVGADRGVDLDEATAGEPPADLDQAAGPVEIPESLAGRMVRLRARLARSQSSLGRGLLSVLSRQKLTEQDWEEIESTLLGADVGVLATTEIVERLRTQTRVIGAASGDELRRLLGDELVRALDPDLDRELHLASVEGQPAVVLVVGVNGAGKTTTCGKIARVLVGGGSAVMLGAADTFRAAAAEQLTTWGERVGVRTVRGLEGSDPASVAFESVKQGAAAGVDVVVVDTAGRLHTKTGLMDELGKVKRVLEKRRPVSETLLVLDATTGQNGVVQARVFTEAVDITGIVLTKLDGTAKGGIVIAVQRELGIPVKLIGLGEGPDDLAAFDPRSFTDALLS